MRKPRGILSRAFAAAMVVWLGLVLAEPLPLDACLMHGSHSMHSAEMAGHSAHHPMGAGHDRSGKPASHQCICIGDCSTAKLSLALPARLVDAPETVAVARSERPRTAGALPRGGLREHTLPPANGPPSIS